jgi:hypothetical protein
LAFNPTSSSSVHNSNHTHTLLREFFYLFIKNLSHAYFHNMPPLSLMQAQSASANAAESAMRSAPKRVNAMMRDAAFCCMSRCLPSSASFSLRLFAGL